MQSTMTNTVTFETSLSCAQTLDAQDPLKAFRDEFHFPQHEGKNCLYFCGNSLGLQPKSTVFHVMAELEKWQQLGVEGHFRTEMPWVSYHRNVTESLAKIVGALPSEVIAMNSLTVNLHLMMVTFYRPTSSRYKIIMEADAFPSDHYAIASQAQEKGFDPKEAVIQLYPREGEVTLRTEDILSTIEKEGDSLALVLLGGVNYYTGQYFNLKAITEKAHQVGAKAGFDLAHAVGNVPLQLHDSNADFAVWCSYKYLNSSPGGVSGAFIHERHAQSFELQRFAGWWGHDEKERFLMDKKFKPMAGAEGWQLSNAPILLMAAHKASLDLFDKAGMNNLVAKSKLLTGYLEFLIRDFNAQSDSLKIKIITPKNPEERGCQLSLVMSERGKEIHEYISERGVIADWREPDVIRIAPVPLYNSFEDVFRFYELLKEVGFNHG